MCWWWETHKFAECFNRLSRLFNNPFEYWLMNTFHQKKFEMGLFLTLSFEFRKIWYVNCCLYTFQPIKTALFPNMFYSSRNLLQYFTEQTTLKKSVVLLNLSTKRTDNRKAKESVGKLLVIDLFSLLPHFRPRDVPWRFIPLSILKSIIHTHSNNSNHI